MASTAVSPQPQLLTDPDAWLASKQPKPLTDPDQWMTQKGFLTAPGHKLPPQPSSGLPSDLPAKIGGAIMTALPYAGATAATMMGQPEAWLPAMAMAGAGGAAGSALEQGARAVTGINPPTSLTDAASKVAEEGAGQALGEGLGRGIGWIAGKTIGKYLNPERLYQSALKPIGSNPEKAAKLVATGLDEGIPLNGTAQSMAESRIDDLGNQVKNIIASNPQNIDPATYVPTVQRNLDTLRKQWGRSGSQGAQFVNQIDNAERNFLLREGNPQPIVKQVPTQIPSGILGPNGQQTTNTVMNTVTVKPEDMDLNTLRGQVQSIPALSAQKIKQSTYNSLRSAAPGAYEAGSHPGVSTEVEQALAQSMREELENIYPDLHDINARQGSLIGLNDAIGRFVKREGNKQITPYFMFPAVGGALGFGAGGVEGGALGAAGLLGAHITRQMLEDPAVKSALAITLNDARNSTAGRLASKILPSPGNAMRTVAGAVNELATPDYQPPGSQGAIVPQNPYRANPYK